MGKTSEKRTEIFAGKTFEENVTTNGSTNIYIKSAIQTVKIKNIK